MRFEDELDKLNEFQREAVLDNSDACIVNANVGSGKTTVLITKIIYLHYEKHVPYEDMIVLTFTNKAALEIKTRLLNLDNRRNEKELTGFGTFHSVSLNLLKTILPIETLGYTKDFTVIEPDEELDIAHQIIQENNLTIKYQNRLKKRLEQIMASETEKSKSKYHDDINILKDMLKKEKIKQNKFTFYDLLSVSILLLGVKQVKPQWIIIDEVQDSDDMQLAFIEKIKSQNTKLFAVGDPNQIIYSWRGSKANVFFALKSKFNARELSLPINYRSSVSILEAAKCFLQSGGALIGVREQGSKIVVRNHYNPFNEAQYLCTKIQELHNRGVNYRDIAIFYRLQNQSQMFEDTFKKNQLPYDVSLKKTIKDIPVLNWFIRLLRFSINTNDLSSGVYVLADNRFGEDITEVKARKIIKNALIEQSNLLKRMLASKEGCKNPVDSAYIYDYFQLDDYIQPTSAAYTENKQSIMILLDIIMQYGSAKQMGYLEGLSHFINSSALYGLSILQKNVNYDDDSVKLMTLHASKGLEFQYVYIVGVNYGLIPIQARNPEEEEEERRLFFVGITRAKDYLELSYYTNPDNYRALEGESRFINMIPEQLLMRDTVEASKLTLNDLRKEVALSKQTAKEIDNAAADIVTVKHEKYGIGSIIKEDDNMVEVKFEKYGVKEFIKAFCELEYLSQGSFKEVRLRDIDEDVCEMVPAQLPERFRKRARHFLHYPGD